jgi:hypothetical protein
MVFRARKGGCGGTWSAKGLEAVCYAAGYRGKEGHLRASSFLKVVFWHVLRWCACLSALTDPHSRKELRSKFAEVSGHNKQLRLDQASSTGAPGLHPVQGLIFSQYFFILQRTLTKNITM